MPRYYFDVRDGDHVTRDDHGVEFPSVEIARAEASRALAEIALDVVARSACRRLAMEVRDDADKPLLRLALSFRVDEVRGDGAGDEATGGPAAPPLRRG